MVGLRKVVCDRLDPHDLMMFELVSFDKGFVVFA